MRCQACRKRYSAAWPQPAPGGSSSPGEFFFAALFFAGIAAVVWLFDTPWFLIPAAAAALCVLVLPLAWWDCHGPVALSSHGGERCPHCGAKNRIWPWSL